MSKEITDITDLQKAWEVTDTKEYDELKTYSQNQFKVIVDLQKKNNALQEEIKSLQTMLQSNLPVIQLETNDLGIPNERLICEVQLQLLKTNAVTRELTKEEATKVQIYVDILDKIKKKPNEQPGLDKFDDNDLINIVQLHGKN